MAEALAAIEAVHALGPRVVLVTSLRLDDTPADALDLIASDGLGRFRLRTPLLPLTVNGAGDLIAALFFAHHLTHRLGRGGAVARGLVAVRRAQPYRRAGLARNVAGRRAGGIRDIRAASSTRARSDNPGEFSMRRRFATLDVFTDRRFAGNPLAVVLDADGLDTAAMQAIAREFNHPETVFVLPPRIRRTARALRIFTPARELPFAGHPTVGTAVLLALRDGGGAGRELVLEEPIGPVRCTLEAGAGERGRVRFVVPQLPAEVGTRARRRDDRGRAGACAATRSASTGSGRRAGRPAMPFTFVPVAGLAALARCRPDPATSSRRPSAPAGAAFSSAARRRARPRFPRPHVRAAAWAFAEDPATGSAAAAFAGVLARCAGLPTASMRSRSSRATRWAVRA